MDAQQDRLTVLGVVFFIGLFANIGLAGTIWLVHEHVEAAAVAVVSGLAGTAVGGLVALLASTRSAPPAPVAPDG